MNKNNHYIFIAIVAVFLNVVIEVLSRSSIKGTIQHIWESPIYFLFNVFIIMFTLAVSLYFKKKKFVTMVIGSVWLALGIANCVVLSYRIVPFAYIDLFILKLDMDFLQSYLNIGLISMITILIGLLIAAIIIGFKKCTVTVIELKKSLIFMSILACLIGGFYAFNLYSNRFEARISNMQTSYDEFGFVTCFVRSSFERGIHRPEDYSKELVVEVLSNMEMVNEKSDIIPNIVVVQLESFFDPTLLVGTEYSEALLPTFEYLKENYSSGMLDVAVVGGGTANTEFEVLTGMSLEFFGTGEYPYNSLLQDQTCESLAYKLKEVGYTTFAIHNNIASFYERDVVYPNLGFDYFISSEFMENTTTTPEGWIKDKHLTKEIMNCLEHTQNQDFIFTVSVQGHGAFPEEKMEDLAITLDQSPFDEALSNQLEYYVNQIHEMDQFILELITKINILNEPTIVVFYGDHIPSLEITADDLSTQNNYQTEYVIWSNLGIEAEDENISTYQIGSKISQITKLDLGIMATFHQNNLQESDYLEQLQILQYDMLYGEYYAINETIYNPVDMQMGLSQEIKSNLN